MPTFGVAALSVLLLVAGCSAVNTRPASAPVAETNATFANAIALARNDAALTGQARQDNSAQIDRLLAGLDNATLARQAAALPIGEPLYNFAGRALLNRGLALPRPFDRGNFNAGNRPPADRDGYRPPVKLGVLLPLSGEGSKAAVPVRDGLLAGYYGESRRRPEIVFYDTAGTPGGAISAYGLAVVEGADFILGPLGRDETSALFRTALTVPVLALNRGNIAPPAGSASFSLAPEDDGIAAAEFLLAHNARHVLLLRDNSLSREITAFREQLGSRGGEVTGAVTVTDKPGDMTAALQAAAQNPAGIDGIFLALKLAQVRAVVSQLAAVGLGGKLRVATSQLTPIEGIANDRALDGIAIPTQAWGTRNVAGLPASAVAGKMLPSARGSAAKLFAFGHDAWLLSAYLERLATRADGQVQGATGLLRLDGFGNVVRTPAWSTFSGGIPVPLGSSQ